MAPILSQSVENTGRPQIVTNSSSGEFQKLHLQKQTRTVWQATQLVRLNAIYNKN